jgi:putative ABC transport system permease protein
VTGSGRGPMEPVRSLARVFRFPFSRRRMQADINAELAFHLETRIEEIMAEQGIPREEAAAEAAVRFGNVASYRRQLRRIDRAAHNRERITELLDMIFREARQSIRSLSRSPSFSIIALLTLALGLGASTAIFAILDGVVLRPLPYPSAGRLIAVGTTWPGVKAGEEYGISSFMYFRFRQSSRALEKLGVYQTDLFALPPANRAPAQRITAVEASASLFGVLGMKPELGRVFNEQDERSIRPAIVLLSHSIWSVRFGRDPGIVGKVIDVGGLSLEVVGVLPKGARLPDRDADIWVPLYLNPSDPPQNNHTLSAIGLMQDGTTVESTYRELDALTRRIVTDYPHVYGSEFMRTTGFALFARSLRDQVIGTEVAKVLWIIFASVLLVLAIAATNVAALFMVRMSARQREIAIRSALGADRGRIAIHCMSESLLLASGAALGAIALASALIKIVLAFAPANLPRLEEIHLDSHGVLFCAAASLLIGVVFGLLPIARTALDIGILRDGRRGLSGSRSQSASRRSLVLLQVALSVVLLVSAGLLAKSFARLRSTRPGFDSHGVLTMSIALRPDRYRSDAQIVGFWRELAERVEAVPGVRSAGGTTSLPLTEEAGCTEVFAQDSRLSDAERDPCVPVLFVAPGYFATMRIPVEGAEPGWNENETGAGTMVISRVLASRLWPGESPIGKTLVISQQRRLAFRIAGIAGDVRADRLEKPPIAAAYFPLAAPASAGPVDRSDFDAIYLHFVVRSDSLDRGKLGAAVRDAASQIDPRVAVAELRSMESIVSSSLARTTFAALLLAIAAAIAMSLSAVGIYGVISYGITERRAELGVRVALGARVLEIMRVVVGEAVRLAVLGAALGDMLALVASRALRSLLYEVSPSDPVVAIGAVVALLCVAIAASYAPARRASAIDPAESLRAD